MGPFYSIGSGVVILFEQGNFLPVCRLERSTCKGEIKVELILTAGLQCMKHGDALPPTKPATPPGRDPRPASGLPSQPRPRRRPASHPRPADVVALHGCTAYDVSIRQLLQRPSSSSCIHIPALVSHCSMPSGRGQRLPTITKTRGFSAGSDLALCLYAPRRVDCLKKKTGNTGRVFPDTHLWRLEPKWRRRHVPCRTLTFNT